MSDKPPLDKLAYTYAEAALVIGVSLRSIFKYVADGELIARKSGRRSLILASELLAYLQALPAVARDEVEPGV